jgi:hypothetical protein
VTEVGYVLVVTGALTAGASIAFIAPHIVLKLLFGVSNPDLATTTIARHWGLLVGLIGALLIYAAFHPEVRAPIMIAATIEKLAIALLVFATPLRKIPAATIVVSADTVMALLYIIMLILLPGCISFGYNNVSSVPNN